MEARSIAGFARLVAMVCVGEVGAVLALEAFCNERDLLSVATVIANPAIGGRRSCTVTTKDTSVGRSTSVTK